MRTKKKEGYFMILSIILWVIFLVIYFLFDVNLDIKINPYLFLILRVNKKNQKKLYDILRENFKNEN